MHDLDALRGIDYAYLLGLYLGDGHITTHHRGVHRLGITLDRKIPWNHSRVRPRDGGRDASSKVGIQHCRNMHADFVYSYSRAWPCLFPQHGPGRKHLREIRLSGWQLSLVEKEPKPLLRGLIHSDGSHSVNTIKHPKKTYVYPRYLFSNKSEDIKRIFCNACDLLGIEWRVMNAKDISIARRESIALMDEFVGPKA
jgi:hypothetical protein